MTLPADAIVQTERALLGSGLLDNSLWQHISKVSSDDFCLDSHRRIFTQMARMAEAGRPIDLITLTLELSDLNQLETCGGPGYLGSLIEGVIPENVAAYVRRVREAAQERRYSHLLEALSQSTKADDRLAKLEQMQGLLQDKTAAPQRIRAFADIPDITTLEIAAAEYLVPALGIARNTITLWTGPDGDGKTYLAQTMALAVSRGAEFLGMECQQAPVLYVDLENPGYVVQERMQALIEDGSAPAGLRFWGTWLDLDQQPPQAGSELLLTICKDSKPLLIVDPFRYFHTAEENDSTEMSGVMQYLRACASYGAAVVILHHPAKTEGSTGRGSSAIRGACDLAFLHTLDKEAGLITLKVDKNRLGPSRTITLRADFEEGKFELSEAPYITRRNDELDRIEEIIGANPGITQNAIWKQSGGQRNRVIRLLKEGSGARWATEKGKYGSILYRLLAKSLYPKDGTAGTAHNEATCTAVPTPLGVVQGTGCVGPKSLPSCAKCGSFALYQGECQTCAGRA